MRLIDADALERHEADTYGAREDVVYAEDIDNAPTIESEPVIHGRWDDDPYDPRFVCSECGKWLLVEDATAEMNYCPNCGAKMDGGADHERS